jgi:3,4-dihydroxy 2-butanone 4-phosphate synthase / GTP cyclohydrolase II
MTTTVSTKPSLGLTDHSSADAPKGPTIRFDTIEAALAAIAAGEMIVVVDDDDRENEGDLIMAACKATAEKVAFMIRHTSGILCTPILEEDAKRLHLDPMVGRNDAPMSTAFTVSIDYSKGLTTGISAEERAATAVALTSSNIGAADFVRPGHIFPLVGRQGGVLVRSGHTEAGIDLAVLAGCPPVGLLAELVNDDGTVQRLPQLLEFARIHNLRIITIADLIAYRQRREHLVERTMEFRVKTRIGEAQAYAYRTKFEDAEHLALVFGNIHDLESVPVRIHREKLIDDLFGPQTEHDESLLDASLDRIEKLGAGVLIYLRSGFVGVPLENLKGTKEDARKAQWLEIGVGAQILRDLELSRIRLIAGREVDFVGVKGFGLTLEATELL